MLGPSAPTEACSFEILGATDAFKRMMRDFGSFMVAWHAGFFLLHGGWLLSLSSKKMCPDRMAIGISDDVFKEQLRLAPSCLFREDSKRHLKATKTRWQVYCFSLEYCGFRERQ